MKVELKKAIVLYICVVSALTTFLIRNELKTPTTTTAIAYESDNVETVPIVFDGMTVDELGQKFDRILKSDLAGKGRVIAQKSTDIGLDPYIALAIILQETGCSWNCSSLVKTNNNIGGMRSGGRYIYYNTLEEGIDAYINNLYYNYYAKGLTTPELMNKKYAESKSWSVNVNKFIDRIKAA